MADLIGKQFLSGPGGVNLGEIDAEAAAAIKAARGPIRLQHGYEGANGFGNRHVEGYGPRMAQIRGLGFKTFFDFSVAVAAHYEKIGEGNNGRIILIRRHQGCDLRLICEFVPGADPYWTVVTGLPYRIARCVVLFERERASGSEPTPDVAVRRPRFATLSLPKKSSVGDSGS